jgi:chloramphenicol O-acetyltransferase type A
LHPNDGLSPLFQVLAQCNIRHHNNPTAPDLVSLRMTSPKPVFLDLRQWQRRSAFDFFRGFDIPWFNICTRVDVSRLRQAVKASGIGSIWLAYHFLAIRLANDIAPFRYRLQGDQVRVHDEVHGSTTVLREDESFGFATLEHQRDFAAFSSQGAAAIAQARQRGSPFEPNKHENATVHMTTLPWTHFSSYSNARQRGPHDSIPKIAFGRIDAEGDRLWMPLSLEVHHALMDGLHVGRFIEGFEAALQSPQTWLESQGEM